MKPGLSDLIQALEALSDQDQRYFVALFLEQLEGDRRWEELLEQPESESALSRMLAEARAEVEQGQATGLYEGLEARQASQPQA